MTNFFDRILALNSQGPFRAERVGPDDALKGGRTPVLVDPQPNAVLGTALTGLEDKYWEGKLERPAQIVLGLGCFWGVERMFWGVDGVWGTSVGYAGGYTPNPTYREVCTGRTGHAEVVRIVFDEAAVSLEQLLQIAFENHDPTKGDRQGNDVGTQYRSCVYTQDAEQLGRVQRAIEGWQQRFTDAGFGAITTEVAELANIGDGHYYLAEDEYQQYLHKHPDGYCNHGSNGVSCPVGVLGD
ncbi:peptide-methionine (S)-S-oxide reductase MsrA [Corynebacterium macclintockiae]|uniref:peptide-methionine (S)-S-oxide reductase MsrA n=1 Tax=Corynebacterium macclintockiae TaxID=2913501 RepID=UPI003EBE166C